MADISREIRDFREAVYGEEVRGSMVSLAEKVNAEAAEASAAAARSAASAGAAASNAALAASRADTAAGNVEQAINRAGITAEKMAAAIKSAEDAEYYSEQSESFARGGTGVRAGEDTDNAEYYSRQSKAFLGRTEQAGADAVQNINNAAAEAVESIGGAAEGAIVGIEKAGGNVMESINTAASGLKPDIHINTDDGHMYYTGGLFGLIVNQETGHLEVGIA